MRLKSYLLITGFTAAALFGATPAFADDASPEPGNGAPSPVESAPPEQSPDDGSGRPSEDPLVPIPAECEALIEESGPWAPEELPEIENGMTCEEIVAVWEEELEEEAGNGAPPAEPQPVDPNYTG